MQMRIRPFPPQIAVTATFRIDARFIYDDRYTNPRIHGPSVVLSAGTQETPRVQPSSPPFSLDPRQDAIPRHQDDYFPSTTSSHSFRNSELHPDLQTNNCSPSSTLRLSEISHACLTVSILRPRASSSSSFYP
ncbi:hypothetical protein VTJ04DRAFT_8481 [Mycothermus thermophilus]|uniref:uncharacterized protein n=1 Tax=Humicola insolens TaxID=85995 RepID=UPI003744A34A